MKHIYFLAFLLFWNASPLFTQNINYDARITSFRADGCNDPFGDEERTWKGYISDNIDQLESYSGCVRCDQSGVCTRSGNFASRARNNIAATEIRTRLDAWEDDAGNRCDFDDSSFNGDDCRVQEPCTYQLDSPVEYELRSRTMNCGPSDNYMTVNYNYRYATTSLSDATEYLQSSLLGGGGRSFWGARGNWAYSDFDCAASGTISNNGTSSMRTTVNCKNSVFFRWRVSSEENYDFLEFYINGVRQARISGEVGWTVVTFPLDYGSNTVEWRYVKDGSVSRGLDRGFIDLIQFTNATNIIPGTITGDQTICSGDNPSNISSTALAQSYGISINYQWEQSINGVDWTSIGGATAASYNPPAGLTQTTYYRRSVRDNCFAPIGYSNEVTITVNPLPNGNLVGTTTICPGSTVDLTFTATAGAGPFDVHYNGMTANDLASGGSITVMPSSTTTYSLVAITDANSCTRNTGLGTSATVSVQEESTAPTNVAGPANAVCPQVTSTLTASGGADGAGGEIKWYSEANGQGPLLGTGNSIDVAPMMTTTYYARREGDCNVTSDLPFTLNVKAFEYAAAASKTSVGYCTDNNGLHHFFDADDKIILTISGDLDGATASPEVTIANNGSFYQTSVGGPGNCDGPGYPGEEYFELPRSWNVEFSGTLNPPYSVRIYMPASEVDAMTMAAANHISDNPVCGYTYKNAVPNGLVWFKSTAAAYVAPQYDLPTQLTAMQGSMNGINYYELSNITSFSGGSAGIVLLPSPALPVELDYFVGKSIGPKVNELSWQTATEDGNAYFELERRSDNEADFHAITRIAGAGNSNEAIQYRYEDDQLNVAKTHYYRLRQVDEDGTFTYSNIVAITNDIDANAALSIFPNPASSTTSLSFYHTKQEMLTATIRTTDGKVAQQATIPAENGINQQEINVSKLPTAVYLLDIRTAQGELIATEFLVIKH